MRRHAPSGDFTWSHISRAEGDGSERRRHDRGLVARHAHGAGGEHDSRTFRFLRRAELERREALVTAGQVDDLDRRLLAAVRHADAVRSARQLERLRRGAARHAIDPHLSAVRGILTLFIRDRRTHVDQTRRRRFGARVRIDTFAD
jgi:hypothetical protein